MAQQKILRSHRARIEAVKHIIPTQEHVSLFDREAFVEFLLLEDIHRLYLYRYDKVKARKPATQEGIFYQKKQLEKMHYVIYMVTVCIEIMEGKMDYGDFTAVWKAIHEHQLMVAAGNMKYLDNLVKLVEIMLGDISREALEAAQKMRDREEFMAELEDHDANMRRIKGLEEYVVDKIAQVVMPQDTSNNRPKSNSNLI